MRPTLTLAAGGASPAASNEKQTITLEDLRRLDARDLDEKLHGLGLSRQAAKRVTYLVKAAERAEKGAPATCADGRVTIILNACGKAACPDAQR